MEFFRPVEVKEKYINRIAKGISDFIYDFMFKGIFNILKDTAVYNANDALFDAIKSGRVYYKNGAFRTDTKFSNAVSLKLEKIGAKFKNGAYHIARANIPPEYIQAIDIAATITNAKLYAITQYLNSFELPEFDLKPFINTAVTEMFKTLELDILKSAKEKNVPVIELGITQPKVTISEPSVKDIEGYWDEKEREAERLHGEWQDAKDSGNKEAEELAAQKLAEFQKDKYANAPTLDYTIDDIELDKQTESIARDYVYNMEYWVKNWTVKEITQMRKDVFDMVQKGVRESEIQKYFETRWNVGKNKAKFLAHNESHLASAVIIKTQFEKLGAKRFKWLRSTAREKRKSHEKYYNKIFELDNPPVIDDKLNIKGLPRQIWNCMCQMQIVVPTYAEYQQNKSIIGKIKNAIKGRQRNNYLNRYRRFGTGQTL